MGIEIENLQVKLPCILKEQRDVKLLIASNYWKEILETVKEFDWLEVLIYKPTIDNYIKDAEKIAEELNKRTMDLGDFFAETRRN